MSMIHVIYGAGTYGKRLLEMMQEEHRQIDYFCQSIRGGQKEYCGIQLLSYDELFALPNEKIVYIAIYDKEVSKKIYSRLMNRLDRRILAVYECGEYIADFTEKIPSYQVDDEYEKDLAVNSWGKYFEQPSLLERQESALLSGLASSDVKKVKNIIHRMKMLYEKDTKEELFTDFEKRMILAYESDIRKNLKKKYDAEHMCSVWQYKNYFLPEDIYPCPTIFGYGCSMNLVNKEYIYDKDIIDAGAYVGDSSVWLAQYTEKKVYAFEPFEENCKRIPIVCDMNGIDNVVPVSLGLSNQVGESKLYVASSEEGSGIVKRDGVSYEQERLIQTETVDQYVQEHGLRVGIIKVDVEGGERELLGGAMQTIREQKPYLIISIYHSGDDFFEIKPMIEQLHLGYHFHITQPYLRNWAIVDTALVCMPKEAL